MQGQFRFNQMYQVIFGKDAATAIAAEAKRLQARRVFLLVSGSLQAGTNEIDKVQTALGQRMAGLFDKMPAHTPRDAVIDAANAARAAEADLLITFGGGSLTDGGKVVQICLRHNVDSVEGLDDYCIKTRTDGTVIMPDYDPPTVRQITVPTTLSGGEFNPLAGCTDHRRKVKEGYRNPGLVPVSVILDPEPTRHTPEWLWLSTGIRAVDHAVEGLCSVRANPYCDGTALHALRLLSRGLQRIKTDPGDMVARLDCQIGAWMSMTGVIGGVPMGASHGIGHILGGTCDVPHGYTSCVMLPAVLTWNEAVNPERQAMVSEAFGRKGDRAADVLRDFVADLGMPTTLGEVGVDPEQYELVAKNSLHDRWLHTNPRKIYGVEDVIEILTLAA